VAKLKDDLTRQEFVNELHATLRPTSASTDEWFHFKPVVYNAAVKVVGVQHKRHKDWFDENDLAARKTLDDMYVKHLAWINDKSSANKKVPISRLVM